MFTSINKKQALILLFFSLRLFVANLSQPATQPLGGVQDPESEEEEEEDAETVS